MVFDFEQTHLFVGGVFCRFCRNEIIICFRVIYGVVLSLSRSRSCSPGSTLVIEKIIFKIPNFTKFLDI